jgi:pyruvate dehydrogenase E1 component beta subunit
MMRQISYCEALNEALAQEMERDPEVFVYGIGVPDHKRIFGSTVGLVEKFGPERCFDTPLAEDSMTGFGLGAAINGMRPVHVHMRVDFLLLAMNQLANMVSSYCYGSGGRLKVPLVIRAVIGRGWGQGFQHSKSMYSVFAHIPGLKVVLPTTPRDAKGLLISAIRDDNPVIFIEHRWLYYVRGEVPEEPFTMPLGEGNILREGRDVTVVATSWMNVEALKAAEVMEKHGVSVEVVDPRTIAPFNDELIVKSVEKTGHCIVADNDWLDCGFSAEVAARVSEKCFDKLKSPVVRIGFAPTPCPCTRPLENHFYPNAINIIRAIEKKMKLQPVDLSNEEFYSYESKFTGPF